MCATHLSPKIEFVGWREVPDFPAYEVSECGVVRNRITGQRLKPQPRKGYLKVSLYRDGKPHQISVQHIVLTAFVGPRPPGMECGHRDGNTHHNHKDNLRWMTHLENIGEKVLHGTHQIGLKNPAVKLTPEQVLAIRAGKTAQPYRDQRTLAKQYGVTQALVSKIQRKELWGHL